MEISIDEAGTFAVKGAKEHSWCVVAAISFPETEKRQYQSILSNLKRRELINYNQEIKLYQTKEKNYFQFLSDLSKVSCALFCTATDSYLNHENLVAEHQKQQANSIGVNAPKMKHASGKEAIHYLISQIENLPIQLYIQLSCQIQLMHSFIDRGISYFVQRQPNSLKSFRWRIDQKEPNKKIDFEDAFEKFSPALLQSFSLNNPSMALTWCDYRPMEKFMYMEGEMPDYLIEQFPELNDDKGFNVQKIIRDDIKFLDSKSHLGIQIADLLASGIRKVLRQEFDDNHLAAELLGKLMVQNYDNSPPIKLVTFGSEVKLDSSVAELVKIMIKHCKFMRPKS
jgi:hypothetical protein